MFSSLEQIIISVGVKVLRVQHNPALQILLTPGIIDGQMACGPVTRHGPVVGGPRPAWPDA